MASTRSICDVCVFRVEVTNKLTHFETALRQMSAFFFTNFILYFPFHFILCWTTWESGSNDLWRKFLWKLKNKLNRRNDIVIRSKGEFLFIFASVQASVNCRSNCFCGNQNNRRNEIKFNLVVEMFRDQRLRPENKKLIIIFIFFLRRNHQRNRCFQHNLSSTRWHGSWIVFMWSHTRARANIRPKTRNYLHLRNRQINWIVRRQPKNLSAEFRCNFVAIDARLQNSSHVHICVS